MPESAGHDRMLASEIDACGNLGGRRFEPESGHDLSHVTSLVWMKSARSRIR
jgi:hypothetical protein